MKFLINNLKMSRRFASRHFEIIYLKFHNFRFEINSFNSFSSSRAQSISKKSLLIFSCFPDERKETFQVQSGPGIKKAGLEFYIRVGQISIWRVGGHWTGSYSDSDPSLPSMSKLI